MKSMVEDDRINKRPRSVVYHDFLSPLQGGCNINITQAKAAKARLKPGLCFHGPSGRRSAFPDVMSLFQLSGATFCTCPNSNSLQVRNAANPIGRF
jgi:hypothetical protein